MPTPSLNYVEIKSLQQLFDFFDIDRSVSLSKENYYRPRKYYRLQKSEAKCQFLNGRTVCGQEHQIGYVVETKNAKLVIIGHCCALKHLGIDDKDIQREFSKARRNEDFERRRAFVLKFLSTRDAVVEDLQLLEKNSEHFFLESSRIIQLLPKQIRKNLEDRWKRRDFSLRWRCLKPKMRDKGNGRQEVIRYEWSAVEYPPLSGLGSWLHPRWGSSSKNISELRTQLEKLPKHSLLSVDQVKEAEKVIKQIKELDHVKAWHAQQLELISQFCEKENIMRLAFLSDDRNLRTETIRAVYSILGEKPPAEAAQIIADIDNSLREKYGASSLKIAS